MSLRWHAETASALGARTEFRLLNQPQSGPKRVMLGGEDDDAARQGLEQMISAGPMGQTPLCTAVRGSASLPPPSVIVSLR